jgi:hypothetical protein
MRALVELDQIASAEHLGDQLIAFCETAVAPMDLAWTGKTGNGLNPGLQC